MCIWVSDHLCCLCQHTVLVFHDPFGHSSYHTFVAPLASPSLLLSYLNTLQVLPPPLSPPVPLFACCLPAFLTCQLGKEGFISFGFLTWWCAAAAGTPEVCAVAPRWWWEVKGSFHSLWELCILDASRWLLSWDKLIHPIVAGGEAAGQLGGTTT